MKKALKVVSISFIVFVFLSSCISLWEEFVGVRRYYNLFIKHRDILFYKYAKYTTPYFYDLTEKEAIIFYCADIIVHLACISFCITYFISLIKGSSPKALFSAWMKKRKDKKESNLKLKIEKLNNKLNNTKSDE